MAESGVNVKALETRPVLAPGLDVYINAYQELGYDRPMGLSLGPIPWSSIIKWCEVHEINDINDIDTLIRYLRKLEQVDAEIAERKKGKTNG